MSNEASFHARITADAKQFVAEMQGAAAALATLVKQAESAGKVSTSGARSEGSKAVREIKDAYGTARKEADSLHAEAMQQIQQENDARAKTSTKSGGSAYSKREAIIASGTFAEARAIRAQEEREEAAAQKRRDLITKSAFDEARRMAAQRIRDAKDQAAAERRADAARAKIQQRELDAMVTGRYALYDQANGYDLVARKAAMLTAALASTVVVAAQFETAFTSVDRAMQPLPDEIDGIRASLFQMSQEMPIAFADMSKIATLGAQMGITASGIEEFTQNVAAFSAVTGSTIDETAQKFGRIAALANIDPTDFNKLGSAVAYTGINAVATEQEILALTESIAAATTNAGFAADETIALSTTLASLGVAPEQARGVVLRVFADITRAAETGGERLAEFGKIAGLSAEQASAMWKSNPQEFFNSLLTGLGSVENFTAAMDSLGFTETRETNVLQRLSQNMNIYNKSLVDSQKSYAEGTFLADAYAKTADNLEAKFQTLLNTLQSLADTMGSGLIGPMGAFVDILKDASIAAEKFFKSPIGQLITPLATGMGAAVAAITAFRAISLKATAQLFAMRTAMIQMGRAGDLASGGIRNSIMTMMGLQRAVEMSDGSIKFLTRSQYELALAEGAVTKHTTSGAVALNGWANQSKAAAIGTRIFSAALSTIGVVGAIAGIVAIAGTFINMNKAVMDLAGSGGGLASFRDAMYADTKAVTEGAAYYGKYKSTITETQNVAKGYVASLQEVSGGQTQLNSDLTEVNDKLSKQTLYLGENSQAWLANALANDPAVLEMFKQIESSGADAGKVLNDLGIDFKDLQKAALAKPGTGALDYIKRVSPSVADQITKLKSGMQGLGDLNGEGLKSALTLIAATGNGAAATAAKMWLLANAVDGVTSAGVQNSKIMDLIGVLFPKVTEETDDLSTSMDGLAKSSRTVVDYASDLAGIFSRVTEIKFGRREILDDIALGWQNIAQKGEDAAKAIREAEDAIKGITADKEVLKYQLSVAERYGDEKRAAVIRAKLAKVETKLADESENLAEAQEDASMSTKGGTKNAIENRQALLGMSESYAGLIEMYAKTGLKGDALQAKIDELTEKFKTNALQAGYSEEDIQPYVNLFGEFKTVVEETPRDVTVEFKSNVSAATNALNEYNDKVKNSGGTVTTTYKTNGLEKAAIGARIAFLQNQMEIGKQQLAKGNLTPEGLRWLGAGMTSAGAEIAKLQIQLKGLAGGGYVSGPGTSTSDSIPTMLSNGEFVMKASAVSAYGIDFMNAINQQRVSSPMPTPKAVASSSSSQVVYLSPDDRALLRAAINRPVNLFADSTKIASTANTGNILLAQRGLN